MSTLHKRVRAKGWRRDLSPAVRQEAQSRLARELAPPADPEEQERGDRRIVDAAAATQVEVVRQHRNTLSRSRDIANRLLDELDATTGHLGEIEVAIVAATAGDDSPKRREAMMRAVSLPSRASTLANLAHSLTAWHTHPLGQILTSRRAAAGLSGTAGRSRKSGPAMWSGLHPARSIGTGPRPPSR